MRALDAWAIQHIGIPSIVLMENAGRAVAEWVLRRFSAPPADPVLVLAGKGNNAGDGFVAARHLANRGFPVQVRFLGSPEQYPPGSDPRINLEAIRRLGLDIRPARPGTLGGGLSLVVDALFGTGLAGPPRPPADLLIQAVNAVRVLGVPVLAVDIPSGLDCDTGEVLGVAVRATATVTFARPKVGFFRADGPEHVGALEVADISIPAAGPGCPVPAPPPGTLG
ncbi:MAG: NAD(P)H-hydrate epimerase [Acidobacteria bacterium]|nr:NAD(P)H-hydrate epimerase [Acidobacteriota bacterium]